MAMVSQAAGPWGQTPSSAAIPEKMAGTGTCSRLGEPWAHTLLHRHTQGRGHTSTAPRVSLNMCVHTHAHTHMHMHTQVRAHIF